MIGVMNPKIVSSARHRLLFFIFVAFVAAAIPRSGCAIPNTFFGNGFFGPVIPATPRFGANLTRAFFDRNNWNQGEFPGPWQEEPALAGERIDRMTALPAVLGAVPMSVYSYGDENGKTRELAIHFLDAGLFFGFQSGGEKTRGQREIGREKRSLFAKHYRDLSADLRRRLEDGCGRGRQGAIGRSDQLRSVFTDYRWEEFVIRFVARPDHSVSIHVMREGDVPDSFLDIGLEKMGSSRRAEILSSNFRKNDIGDQFIEGLPMFTQGNTPFCGIHSLAMAGRYLGLRIHPEALAAGAGFRNNGSARGSDILGLYRAVGDEIGMQVSTFSKFDARRVEKSIEAGIPVLVWRRVSLQRERAHNEFQAAFRKNPALALGAPNEREKKAWPLRTARGTPSHSSVVTGINPERNEVIFSEPWGEFARDRRMRIEEMEASVYAAFYFRL